MNKALSFPELSFREYGRPAVIYGKSPEFDPQRLPSEVAICINETAFHVGGPCYAIALDDAACKIVAQLAWNPEVTVLLGRLLNVPHAIRFEQMSVHERKVLNWPREDVAEREALYSEAYTSTAAVHLAWLLGCPRIRFSGVGGPSGHHKLFANPNPDETYSARELAESVALELNLKVDA